jgi:glycosyltransferase involved in cell wall biosynthesis
MHQSMAKRILQIGSFLWPNLVGGAEACTRELANRLEAAGDHVVGLTSSINNPTKTEGVTYLRTGRWVQSEKRLGRFEKYIFYIFEQLDVLTALKVLFAIAKMKPDLVIIHSWRGLGVWTPFAVGLSRVPALFVLHDFSLVCFNKAARRQTVNCERRCLLCRISSLAYLPLLIRSKRVRFVAPAEAHAREIARLAGVRLGVATIHNPNKYRMICRERKPEDQISFGYIGRLERAKGFEIFLALAKEFHGRARFLVAGDGQLASSARQAWKLKQIEYFGLVPESEIASLFNRLDVLLVPSIWKENYPGVCVQAMLSGLPVIGSNIGGIPEIITDKVTGFLLPAGDVTAWQRKLSELVISPEIISVLSSRAIADRLRFDADVNFKKYQDFIDGMLLDSRENAR